MKNFEIITKRGSKCQAIVDGEKMRISLEAAAKVRLKEGPMDDDKFAEFCKLNDFCLCKKYLFEMVSRRSWTVAAAKNYLLGKGYAPESVDRRFGPQGVCFEKGLRRGGNPFLQQYHMDPGITQPLVAWRGQIRFPYPGRHCESHD